MYTIVNMLTLPPLLLLLLIFPQPCLILLLIRVLSLMSLNGMRCEIYNLLFCLVQARALLLASYLSILYDKLTAVGLKLFNYDFNYFVGSLTEEDQGNLQILVQAAENDSLEHEGKGNHLGKVLEIAS